MIKHFCDQCGVELLSSNRPAPVGEIDWPVNRRLAGKVPMNSATDEPEVDHFNFDLHVGLNGVWNHGDFCVTCILSFVAGAYGFDVFERK